MKMLSGSWRLTQARLVGLHLQRPCSDGQGFVPFLPALVTSNQTPSMAGNLLRQFLKLFDGFLEKREFRKPGRSQESPLRLRIYAHG
jgi:hypothetical protein